MTLRLGPDWAKELDASPFRLRFELSGGGPNVTQFTRAYDRARTLARAALPIASPVAIIAALPDAWDLPWSEAKYGPRRDPFACLAALGAPTNQPIVSWSSRFFETRDPDDRPWAHRACAVTWDQADILLWNNIAQDIGVRPVAPALCVLVDPARHVSAFAYDDRGMDITSLARTAIEPLRTTYDGWLLDHDRPRMDSAFG
jgi:hypothetical protein